MITGTFNHHLRLPSQVTNHGEESYDVQRVCLSCDWYSRWGSGYPWVFNAKTGTMHLQGVDEFTWCGRKATEEHWLWEL